MGHEGAAMHEEVIISGFGGQGALFAGQLLAYAGMDEGRVVTWIPSYGPEMRGGTAHCTVIISDEPIGSPIIHNPTSCIVLNPESMDKYEPLVKPGGILVVNTSLVRTKATRSDITGGRSAGERTGERAGQRQDAPTSSCWGRCWRPTRSCASIRSRRRWTSTSQRDAGTSSSRTSAPSTAARL